MHITGGYPEFLRRLAADVPEGERTHARLFRAFVDSRLGWSDDWIQGFRAIGHEAEMVVCNSESIQKAWADEHGLSYDEEHWARQILFGQIKAWKPDLIWIQDLYFVSADARKAIRNLMPDAALLGWRFAPTREMAQLRDLDVVVTGADAFADELRRCGVRAEVVPLFFPEAVLNHVGPARERSLRFVFPGSIIQAGGVHALRHQAIVDLLEKTPLEVYAAEPVPQATSPWRAKAVRAWPQALKPALPGWLRKGVPLRAIFPDRIHGAVFGLEYFRLLANAQVCFNSHGDMAAGFAGNMRLFEATGMGTCLLTDWKPNLAEFFEPDREVAAYRTPEEAAEKANFLLAHPAERESMAERGRRRALRDHTLAARLGKMNEIIEQAVRNKRGAP